jgi:hypothetical protein
MKKKLYFYLIVYIFYSCIAYSSQEIKSLLAEQLVSFINVEDNNSDKYHALINQKINTLQFQDAAILFLQSYEKPQRNTYTKNGLERMYALSPDARLSELILWNLALFNEELGNNILAAEMFYNFKKIFPGSVYYWKSRYREIVSSRKICLPYYFDDQKIDQTIILCREYERDIDNHKSEEYQNVINIMQELYNEKIKKYADIARHYIKKYRYTKNTNTLYAAINRISEMYVFLIDAINYINNNERNNFSEIFFNNTMRIIKKIDIFFDKNPIKKPSEIDFNKNFHETISYINANINSLTKELNELIGCITV